MFFFRKQEQAIEAKEKEIQAAKKTLHARIDKDRRSIAQLNKVLSNGVTIKIYHATGGKHD